MRIAFITFEFPPAKIGGAGVYGYNLTKNLAALGHDVEVFVPGSSQEDGVNSRPSLTNLKVRIVPVSRKLPFVALQFWLGLPRAIRHEEENHGEFDVVHINGVSYWFLPRLPSKAKSVVTIHHLASDSAAASEVGLLSRITSVGKEHGYLVSAAERLCIRSAHRLIAVSNFTKQRIVEKYHITPDEIDVVYNGVEDEHSHHRRFDSGLDAAMRGKPIILFVGRVDDRRKGLDVLLNAIPVMLRHLDVRLIVAGGGDLALAKSLATSLRVAKSVRFLGFVDDEKLWNLYEACDVYVSPSRLEGFGLSIAEAMLVGKPVVATNVGGVAEIVTDGENGLLVKSGDSVGLGIATVRILLDKEKSDVFSKNNQAKMRNSFSWSKAAESTLVCYGKAQQTIDAPDYPKYT